MPNDIYKPVTEDSLREFYQQIQPYLNAGVPVIANRFDKADLYSTTEKIVGQWIDGKPLYQRVFYLDHPQSSTSTTAKVVQLETGWNDKTIISVAGSIKNSSDSAQLVFPNFYDSKIADIYVQGGQNLAFRTVSLFVVEYAIIILKYIKNNDTPLLIGCDTDYSTTEKVVGTWIDGKPIYQKTVAFDSTTYTDAGKRRQFTLCVFDDVDFVINTIGQYSQSSGSSYLNGVTFVASDPIQPQYSLFTSLNKSTSKATVYFASAIVQALTNIQGYVTLQYTKTTA